MSYILDTKTQTRTIFLNSLNASTRSPYTFNFTTAISCPQNMRMLISVEEFIISNCFFNINTNNNTIDFYKTLVDIHVEITPGLYILYQHPLLTIL